MHPFTEHGRAAREGCRHELGYGDREIARERGVNRKLRGGLCRYRYVQCPLSFPQHRRQRRGRSRVFAEMTTLGHPQTRLIVLTAKGCALMDKVTLREAVWPP